MDCTSPASHAVIQEEYQPLAGGCAIASDATAGFENRQVNRPRRGRSNNMHDPLVIDDLPARMPRVAKTRPHTHRVKRPVVKGRGLEPERLKQISPGQRPGNRTPNTVYEP